MKRTDLEASWARTRAHLLRAEVAYIDAGGDDRALRDAHDYLDHNELELAADLLADAGDGLATASQMWLALADAADAADEMNLVDRALAWRSRAVRFPCPCCGHVVFDEAPGSYAICPICFWEDDLVQLRWPSYPGGANRPSLIDAQVSYRSSGAMEHRFTGIVRGAAVDEPIDPDWRPCDPDVDNFEVWGQERADWPADRTTLYWWRTSYWRRGTG